MEVLKKILDDIEDYYVNKSSLYQRNIALNLGHFEIVLSPDFPYYDKGVRGVNFSSHEVYVDLSFFTYFDSGIFYKDSYIDNLKYLILVISNEYNLSGIELKYCSYSPFIFFNIDMSLNHFICIPDDKYIGFSSNLWKNYLSSGIKSKINGYYIYHDFHYLDDLLNINSFLVDFDNFILKYGSKGMSLLKSKDIEQIEIYLSVDIDDVSNLEILKKLVSYINSKPKSFYKRKNKSIGLNISIIDNGGFCTERDFDFLDDCRLYFDNFNYSFGD